MSKKPSNSADKQKFFSSESLSEISESEQLTLFDRVCATGGEHPELVEQLQSLLRSSQAAAKQYLNYTAMHADLYGAVRIARAHELVSAEMSGSGVPIHDSAVDITPLGSVLPNTVAAADSSIIYQSNNVTQNDADKNDSAMTVAIPPSSRMPKLAPWLIPLLATAAGVLLLLSVGGEDSSSKASRDTEIASQGITLTPSTPRLSAPSLYSDASTDWLKAVAKINSSYVDGKSLMAGSILLSGDTIEFETGRVEIEFQQGAVVALEGPALFTVSSRNSGVLLSGRLAAIVPPWADGFCIETSRLQVVDRGTSFAVSVNAKQEVEVAVTKGEVEVYSSGHTAGHRVLAGKSVLADHAGVGAGKPNVSLVSLTDRLPKRPDATEVEVVGRYQHDWVSGKPGEPRRVGPWRYFTNGTALIGQPHLYQELLWDPRGIGCYDGDGISNPTGDGPLRLIKLRRGSGHPGHGTKQAFDAIPRYAIAAFQVPEDGHYHIESGWLFRPESLPIDKRPSNASEQLVDVVVHVDEQPPTMAKKCQGDGFLKFEGSLGELHAGATIYVGVGPGEYNYNDRFQWGFFIVRELEPVNDDSI